MQSFLNVLTALKTKTKCTCETFAKLQYIKINNFQQSNQSFKCQGNLYTEKHEVKF